MKGRRTRLSFLILAMVGSVGLLDTRVAYAANTLQALWIFSDEITDAAARQTLVQRSAASGVKAFYLSVYRFPGNTANRRMYEDADIASLIAQAHAQQIEVWAAYGVPDWPALGCAPTAFPLQRMAEVVAYNQANPSAQFDGVMLDIEPSVESNAEREALLNLYQCIRSFLPGSLKLGAAINAFWDMPLVQPQKLLIYYAYPSSINATSTVAGAAAELGKYDYVILGGGLEKVGHQDHPNTVEIIAHPAMANTVVFGYIDLGVTTSSNFPDGEIQTRVDEWKNTGADGIFFDDYGYDWGTTRARQNAAVYHAHQQGMKVCVNAFEPDDAFGNALSPANPSGTPTELNADDFYLYESHQITDGTFVLETPWQNKANKLKAYQSTTEFKGLKIFSITTNDAADVYDEGKFFYSWYSALMYGHEATGWGEYLYSANDAIAPFRTRPNIDPGKSFATDIINISPLFARTTTQGQIQVNTSTHAAGFAATPTGKPVYQRIIDLDLNQVVVMGYRNFAGTACPGDGILCLDQDEIAYADAQGKAGLILAGIETQNCSPSCGPPKVTFFEEGQATLNKETRLVASHFAGNISFGGFAIHRYKASYLGGLAGWPQNNDLVDFIEVGASAGVDDPGLGGGVAWGDYDNDGNLDLYVANAGSNNRLYRNNGAGNNWSFAEAYPNAPIADPGLGKGVAWGDYDNDGDLDLALANYNEANGRFFRNDLDGSGARTFADVTQSARPLITDDAGAGLGVTWGDYDNDGYLDLYVTNEGSHPNAASTNKVNRLYHNNRDGTFTDVGSTAGVAADFGPQGSSRGAAWGDYDNDGDLDLYLATSIGEQNRLYRNDLDIDGSRRFNNVWGSIGVDDIEQGFGVAWGDYDNDGDLDLYVANASGQENRLYQNDNAGTNFVNVGVSAKVNDTGEGQGVAWGDYDNDGDLDLYVTNVRGTNRLYQNNGDRTFTEVGANTGVGDSGDGAGVAWGDYDNDGDLDLYVVKSSGANLLYSNNGVAENRWLTVKLVGTGTSTRSNRDGIGAQVTAVTGKGTATEKRQRRDVDGGSGLFSQSSLPVEFGFGSTATVDELRIRWPSGTVQTLTNVATNQTPFFTVTEPNTPTGSSVPVLPGSGVTLEFESVTLQGETTVSTTSEAPPTPFKVGGTTTFYDIRTTATFSGPVEVCITYPQPLNDPSLWHYENGDWQPVLLNPNPPPNTVCGNVASLSPFAVVEKPASTTTVTVEANFVRKGATTANKVPVDGARVVMLPKSAVQAHCNLLDATCGWVNLAQINTAGDPVMTTANGSVVVTSSVADPNGWVIYIDIEGARAAGATITGGTTKVGVANGDGAAAKRFTNILVADAAGLTATAITQRQQRITGSVLEITYPDTVEWDGTDFLYPFIFTSDSEWEVDICGSVPQGYRIVGDPCLQLFLANETKVSFFEVEETGSPEPHLGLRGQVKHQGKVKALHLDVPGKRKAKGHLKNAENAQVPTAYALHPARPNPFNPVTQIAYQLPEPGEVELVVYDLMGQKIRVLTQGHQEAGTYQVGWDGQDEARHEVASGIYLCRLKTKGFEETRRMALIR